MLPCVLLICYLAWCSAAAAADVADPVGSYGYHALTLKPKPGQEVLQAQLAAEAVLQAASNVAATSINAAALDMVGFPCPVPSAMGHMTCHGGSSTASMRGCGLTGEYMVVITVSGSLLTIF
jgi:hypothetical protein